MSRRANKQKAEAAKLVTRVQREMAERARAASRGGEVLRLNGLMCCIVHGAYGDNGSDWNADPQAFVPLEDRRVPTWAGRNAVVGRAEEAVNNSAAWAMHCARKAHGLDWKGSPLNLPDTVEHVWPMAGIAPGAVGIGSFNVIGPIDPAHEVVS